MERYNFEIRMIEILDNKLCFLLSAHLQDYANGQNCLLKSLTEEMKNALIPQKRK